MAVIAAQVAVSTTAALLSADADGGGASLIVQAPAAATLFVGGAGVTSAAGFPITAGQILSVDLAGPNDQLFGILASGTGTAAVLRVGA
jgi:hypothetical protein